MTADSLRAAIARAAAVWIARTPSVHTRIAYAGDLAQFLAFVGLASDEWEVLARIRPGDVYAWRDALEAHGQMNATVRRKLTAVRSLFSYLSLYGSTGAYPAHGKFEQASSVGKDGKTPGLSPEQCRRLLDAPHPETPAGVRDRSLFAMLSSHRLRVGDSDAPAR